MKFIKILGLVSALFGIVGYNWYLSTEESIYHIVAGIWFLLLAND